MFFVLQIKKSKAKEKFYNSIRDLHTYKCKTPRNKPYDACLRKLAERNKARTS